MAFPTYYRLTDSWSESGSVVVELTKFCVIRATPAGYWVAPEWAYNHHWAQYREEEKRWVPKLGSRYCHPSIEAAKRHYSLRKSRELRHIQARLDKCNQVRGHWDELTEQALEKDGYVDLGQPGSRLFTSLAP